MMPAWFVPFLLGVLFGSYVWPYIISFVMGLFPSKAV